MEERSSELDKMKGKNPFIVPEGYMEGLTDHIMSQLPEKEVQPEARRVSMVTIVRPWLYIAALFAGVLFLYQTMTGFDNDGLSISKDSLRAESTMSTDIYAMQYSYEDEYLEYLETSYAGYILEAELADFE